MQRLAWKCTTAGLLVDNPKSLQNKHGLNLSTGDMATVVTHRIYEAQTSAECEGHSLAPSFPNAFNSLSLILSHLAYAWLHIETLRFWSERGCQSGGSCQFVIHLRQHIKWNGRFYSEWFKVTHVNIYSMTSTPQQFPLGHGLIPLQADRRTNMRVAMNFIWYLIQRSAVSFYSVKSIVVKNIVVAMCFQ
jgi:hypothetical protein